MVSGIATGIRLANARSSRILRSDMRVLFIWSTTHLDICAGDLANIRSQLPSADSKSTTPRPKRHSNAISGSPDGNMENSLCTSVGCPCLGPPNIAKKSSTHASRHHRPGSTHCSPQGIIAKRAAEINQISRPNMKCGTSTFSRVCVRAFPPYQRNFVAIKRAAHGAAVASGCPLSTIQVETAVPPSSPGIVDRLCTAPLTLKKLSPALRILSGWPRVWSTNTPLST